MKNNDKSQQRATNKYRKFRWLNKNQINDRKKIRSSASAYLKSTRSAPRGTASVSLQRTLATTPATFARIVYYVNKGNMYSNHKGSRVQYMSIYTKLVYLLYLNWFTSVTRVSVLISFF